MKERIKLRLKEKGFLDHFKNILYPEVQNVATRSVEPKRKEKREKRLVNMASIQSPSNA